ncbi:anaerobic ribonucleoside-triphosphate reductase activating protein [Candidatus Kaiserbacteria bacterium]|nr:MAG: anaerobic ribonucleoside-triphosphate reductase activating protein [Candidatus Kaiserbacteria bacterium]
MKIGGLQKCSLIDYPGKISAIVFTIGCNFRCPYCHNPELVDETATEMTEEEIFSFLERRKNLLDAVTITGGEPTVHDDLIPFIERIRALGFLVKLDSNGTNPDMLKEVFARGLVDYIAMDIKSPLQKYSETVARPVDVGKIRESIALIMKSGVDYEFRTTVVKSLLSPEDILKIVGEIHGAKQYFLQKFVPTKTLNPAFIRKTTYTDAEFEDMRIMLSPYVEACAVRA